MFQIAVHSQINTLLLRLDPTHKRPRAGLSCHVSLMFCNHKLNTAFHTKWTQCTCIRTCLMQEQSVLFCFVLSWGFLALTTRISSALLCVGILMLACSGNIEKIVIGQNCNSRSKELTFFFLFNTCRTPQYPPLHLHPNIKCPLDTRHR